MLMQKTLVQLMLAVLFTHEMDAMTQSEWRLLYVLQSLGDDPGRWWFVAMHIPLFWALIALTHHASDLVQWVSRRGLAMFCIIHAVLHWRLADDPLSTFSSPLSWGLILGAAALGAAYLGIEVQDARSRKN
ncbi:hypothetical protein MCEMSEM22_01806 [Comamonadaceae bacterium]